jgi:hypothetical protein
MEKTIIKNEPKHIVDKYNRDNADYINAGMLPLWVQSDNAKLEDQRQEKLARKTATLKQAKEDIKKLVIDFFDSQCNVGDVSWQELDRNQRIYIGVDFIYGPRRGYFSWDTETGYRIDLRIPALTPYKPLKDCRDKYLKVPFKEGTEYGYCKDAIIKKLGKYTEILRSQCEEVYKTNELTKQAKEDIPANMSTMLMHLYGDVFGDEPITVEYQGMNVDKQGRLSVNVRIKLVSGGYYSRSKEVNFICLTGNVLEYAQLEKKKRLEIATLEKKINEIKKDTEEKLKLLKPTF